MREQADADHIPGIHGVDETEPAHEPRLNRFWWALLWLIVIVLAILPIPWW
jgi:hypothetical protein